jgi:hypothetical protein
VPKDLKVHRGLKVVFQVFQEFQGLKESKERKELQMLQQGLKEP